MQHNEITVSRLPEGLTKIILGGTDNYAFIIRTFLTCWVKEVEEDIDVLR